MSKKKFTARELLKIKEGSIPLPIHFVRDRNVVEVWSMDSFTPRDDGPKEITIRIHIKGKPDHTVTLKRSDEDKTNKTRSKNLKK